MCFNIVFIINIVYFCPKSSALVSSYQVTFKYFSFQLLFKLIYLSFNSWVVHSVLVLMFWPILIVLLFRKYLNFLCCFLIQIFSVNYFNCFLNYHCKSWNTCQLFKESDILEGKTGLICFYKQYLSFNNYSISCILLLSKKK